MTDQPNAMGAAPGRTILRASILAAAASVLFAAAPATSSAALPRELWAATPTSFELASLKRLRARGVNAVLASHLSKAQLARVRAAKLLVLSPRSSSGLRVVRLASPGGVLRVKPHGKTRVLAFVQLTIDFDSRAWGLAVARAADTGWLDLGVAPAGMNRRGALNSYLSVMGRVRRQDRLAPSVPAGLRASELKQASAKLTWRRASDNRGVTGYGLYRDGQRVGSSAAPSAVFTGLSCGRIHRLGVDAFDRAGNRSARSQANVATLSCAPGDSPPPPPPGLGSALPAALPASSGTTYYVATSGSDSNPGTIGQPWKTIQKALGTLTAGQRALVRAGTYAESLDMTRAGSPLAPISVEAYPGERPVVSPSGDRPLEISSTGAYFRFRGFVLEKSPFTSGGNVDIYGHDLEISGNEVRLGKDQGIYSAEGSYRAQILGNWIHDNGEGIAHQSHGIYLQGNDHLVASNLIHDHPKGFGIQVYDRNSRSIITGNTVTGAGHSGIVVGGSGGVDNIRVHNNVFAFNNRYGISHDSTCPTASTADHNVVFGNAWGATQTGCSGLSYAGGNRTTDPLFANYAARDLHLLAGSPAIDYGVLEYSWATDFGGLLRSFGSAPDAGAFERAS